MFPAINALHKLQHTKMRQPGILKAFPWQPCLETCAQHGGGGTLERVRCLWSRIIMADAYHKPSLHLSLILEKMLQSVKRCSTASVLFQSEDTWLTKRCFNADVQERRRKMPPHLNTPDGSEFASQLFNVCSNECHIFNSWIQTDCSFLF